MVMNSNRTLKALTARAARWLKKMLPARSASPSLTFLSTRPAKMAPIDEVVARVRRDCSLD